MRQLGCPIMAVRMENCSIVRSGGGSGRCDCCRGLASGYRPQGRWHRQRRPKAEAQVRRVEVTGLRMVQSSCAAGCRSIVAGRLVGEGSKRIAVGIKQRRRKAEWFVRRPRCGILVPEIVG